MNTAAGLWARPVDWLTHHLVATSMVLLTLSAIIPILIMVNPFPFGWFSNTDLAARAQIGGVAVGVFGVAATVAALWYAAIQFQQANPKQVVVLSAFAVEEHDDRYRIELRIVNGPVYIERLFVRVRLTPQLRMDGLSIVESTSAGGWNEYTPIPADQRDTHDPIFGWNVTRQALAPAEDIEGPSLLVGESVQSLLVRWTWTSERGQGEGRYELLPLSK